MGTASRNAAESLAERRCAPRLAAAKPRNSPAAAGQWSCGAALGARGGSCAITFLFWGVGGVELAARPFGTAAGCSADWELAECEAGWWSARLLLC
jgi:hypothetical protein